MNTDGHTVKRWVVAAIVHLSLIGIVGVADLEAQVVINDSSPSEARSQELRSGDQISLAVRDVPLADALQQLVRNGAALSYSTDLVATSQLVSCDCQQMSLTSILDSILAGTGIEYQELSPSGQILLRAAPRREVRQGSIAGQVLSATTGQPLASIGIELVGTRLVTATDRQGRYQLTGVPAGSYELRAGSIGYKPQSHQVVVSSGGRAVADFQLEEEAVRMDAITVTAGTVAETSVRALPSPVTVVTAEQIQSFAVQDVPEILRMTVPGFVTTREGGPTASFANMSVRGVSNINNATTLKVYIDGVEIANTVNLFEMDPALIERVEILSGPQASTIYGSRAISGVVQIFTKKGVRDAGWAPTLSGSASATTVKSPYVDGTPLGQRFEISGSGGGEYLRYLVGANLENEPEWLDMLRKRQSTVYGNAELSYAGLEVSGQVQVGSGHWQSYWNPITRQMDRELDRPGTPPNSSSDRHFNMYGLNLRYALTPSWTHNLVAGYNTIGNQDRPLRPGADGVYNMSRFNYVRRSLSYNTVLEIPVTQGVGTTWTLGADYTDRTYQGVGFQTKDPTRYEVPKGDDADPLRNFGFFGQTQIGFADAVYLTAGLRADQHPEGASESMTWSPRLGLSVARDLGEIAIKGRLGWGQAVIVPNESQITGSENPGGITLPSPNLKSEMQRGYDVGVDLYLGSRATLGVTYFDQEPINLIQMKFLGQHDDGRLLFQYENVDRVSNKGWEIAGMARPIDEVSVRLTYGSTVSKVLELAPDYTGDLEVGKKIGVRPDYTISGSLAYSPFPGTTVTATAFRYGSWINSDYYQMNLDYGRGDYSKPFTEYEMVYPAFTKFDLSVMQTISERITGFLQIRNAADSGAFEYVNTSVVQPRTTTLGIRFNGL